MTIDTFSLCCLLLPVVNDLILANVVHQEVHETTTQSVTTCYLCLPLLVLLVIVITSSSVSESNTVKPKTNEIKAMEMVACCKITSETSKNLLCFFFLAVLSGLFERTSDLSWICALSSVSVSLSVVGCCRFVDRITPCEMFLELLRSGREDSVSADSSLSSDLAFAMLLLTRQK